MVAHPDHPFRHLDSLKLFTFVISREQITILYAPLLILVMEIADNKEYRNSIPIITNDIYVIGSNIRDTKCPQVLICDGRIS